MKSGTSIFVKITVALLAVVMLISILSISIKYNELLQKRDALKAQVEKEQIELEKLLDEIDREYDDEYIKRIARQELGYRMPDEIIYYNNSGN